MTAEELLVATEETVRLQVSTKLAYAVSSLIGSQQRGLLASIVREDDKAGEWNDAITASIDELAKSADHLKEALLALEALTDRLNSKFAEARNAIDPGK